MEVSLLGVRNIQVTVGMGGPMGDQPCTESWMWPHPVLGDSEHGVDAVEKEAGVAAM